MQTELAALYRPLASRDPEALDRLIALLGSQVYHLARQILGEVGTREDVEEVTSDTFATVWERIAEFDPSRGPLHSWVLMHTKYTALTRRRTLLRQRFTPVGDSKVVPLTAAPEPVETVTPEDTAVQRDQSARLHEALNRLSPGDRDLLVRRYFFEESIADLVNRLGLTRSALDNRLWRARLALKRTVDMLREGKQHGESAV